MKKYLYLLIILSLFISCSKKEEKSKQEKINIVRVNWTGITIKSNILKHILISHNYKVNIIEVSVPLSFKALATSHSDIFLGYWASTMKEIGKPYFKTNEIRKIAVNLDDTRYSLAVPVYAYKAGLKSYNDIYKFKNNLNAQIFGIEENNDGNLLIQKMIDSNMYNLKDFKLVPSSEAGMISNIKKKIETKEFAVFLAWSPHPMNKEIDLKYLEGSNHDIFGPDYGKSEVYTLTSNKLYKNNPEIINFLKNYKFRSNDITEIMVSLKKNPEDINFTVLNYLKANPQIYSIWFKNTIFSQKNFESYINDFLKK